LKIRLTNSSGLIKEADWGFSWKTFIFGAFVPLLRGDLAWFFIGIVLAICTFGLAWLVFPFYYNKIYVKKLLAQGFYPLDELSRMTLVNANIILDKGSVAQERQTTSVPLPPIQPKPPTPVQTEGWICSLCKTINEERFTFCYSCGQKREKAKTNCPKCGTELEERMKFCPVCGTPVTVAASASVEETSTSQPVVARAEPVSTETAVAKKNSSTGAFVAVAVCMIAVTFFAVVPEARESIMSIFGNTTPSSKAAKREEPFKMSAIWVNPSIPSAAIFEEGGIILQLKSMGDNKINFVLKSISAPPSNRVAEVETTATIYKWKGDSFEASFSFDDDNWGNAGKGKIFYDGTKKSLVIDVKETKSNSDSMWLMGSFKERLYSSN